MRRMMLSGVVLAATFLLVAGCDEFSLIDEFYKDTGVPLAIHPASVALKASESVQFVADGGAPDYTYHVVNPGGGEIDPDTGDYVAPAQSGDYEVEVTDEAGNSRASFVYVREPQPLTIEPQSASVVQGGEKQFTATGGSGEYSFSVDDAFGRIEESGLFIADDDTTGTTDIILWDGVNTVVASVTVYLEAAEGEFVVAADPPVIAQNESATITASEAVDPDDVGPVEAVDDNGLDYDEGTAPYVTWPSSSGESGTFNASDWIGEVKVTITSNTPGSAEAVITIVPAVPTNLNANGNTGSPNSIQLAWDHTTPLPDDVNAGFRIERATETGEFTDLAEVGVAERSYRDTDCSPSVNFYTYRIVALTQSGFESEPSGIDFETSNP